MKRRGFMIRSKIIFLILIIALTSCVKTSVEEKRCKSGDTQSCIDAGDQLLFKKKPEKALNYYNRAIEIESKLLNTSEDTTVDPEIVHSYAKFLTALGRRATVYSMLGEYEKCIQDLNVIVRIDPQNMHMRNRRGCAFFAARRYEEALQDFEAVCAANAANKEACVWAEKLKGGLIKSNPMPKGICEAGSVNDG